MPAASEAARNLKRLRERSGLSVREVAAALSRPASTYASYEDKYKKPYLPLELVKALEAIFVGRGDPPIGSGDVLSLAGVTRALLGAEAGTMAPARRPYTGSKQGRSASVEIPELDVSAIGGGGAIPDMSDPQAETETWEIPAALLAGHTQASVASLRIIRVHGDSMVPDFQPGERVLVNTDDRLPSPPGVFIVWDGFGLVIKRLEVVPYSEPATVRLISSNANYGTYERPLGDVVVNGRVIAKWQWT